MRLRFTIYPYNLPAICFSRWHIASSHRPVSFPSRLRAYIEQYCPYIQSVVRTSFSHFTHIGATALKRGGVYRWELIA